VSEGWNLRTAHLASWVEPGSMVCDFGCGDRALRDALPAGCDYIGWDRREIDLASDDWPRLPPHDVAVLAGVLEYVEAPAKVLARMTAPALLLSYEPGGSKDARRIQGWVSDLSATETLDAAAQAGYGLVAVRMWKKQWLGKFRRLA